MNSKDEKIICYFLRGFLDSEATAREYALYVHSSNKKGLKEIRVLLQKIGIRRFHFRVNYKEVWRLYFCGKDNLFIIYRKVGFSIRRKQKKLEKAIKYKHNNNTANYWLVLNLRMKGYGYRRISKLIRIGKWKTRDWYEGRYIPLSVRRKIKLEEFPENWETLRKVFPFLNNPKSTNKPY